MTEQFRGQLEELWNKRKADQLRSQIDDLRRTIDDLTTSYNRLVASGSDLVSETQRVVAKKTRDGIEEANENFADRGFAWWMPLAFLGAVGAVAWLYRKVAATPSVDQGQPPYPNYSGSSETPLSSPTRPVSERG
jgi:hypothetical protein